MKWGKREREIYYWTHLNYLFSNVVYLQEKILNTLICYFRKIDYLTIDIILQKIYNMQKFKFKQ